MRVEITGPQESWTVIGAVVDGCEISVFYDEEFHKDVLIWDGEQWRSRGRLPFSGQPFIHSEGQLLFVTASDGEQVATSEEILRFINADNQQALWSSCTNDSDRLVATYENGLWKSDPATVPGNREWQSPLLVIGALEFQAGYHGGSYSAFPRIAPGRRHRLSSLAAERAS